MRNRSILIFRPGYLGDTIVALPAFRLIADAFPDAERRVLTQFTADPTAAPLGQVLTGTGLVHGYVRYPARARDPRALIELRHEIRRFRPSVLVYLAQPLAGRLKLIRDIAFFRLCAIPKIIGIPYSADLRNPRRLAHELYEHEGARLLRCLSSLGSASLDMHDAFDLKLTSNERATARAILASLPQEAPILIINIGGKVPVKDWGIANWKLLLSRLSTQLPMWSIVMIGGAADRERSEQLRGSWNGHSLNLCGELPVRISAAAIEQAHLFVGHDSGPIHLAAAVGTTCVAIFSSRHLPGVWFPWGARHRIIYNDVPCRNCNLDVCSRYANKCIKSISVDEVMLHISDALRSIHDDGTHTPQPDRFRPNLQI